MHQSVGNSQSKDGQEKSANVSAAKENLNVLAESDGIHAVAPPASAPSESDISYSGWRVVLAACLGVMAGFGSSSSTPSPYS